MLMIVYVLSDLTWLYPSLVEGESHGILYISILCLRPNTLNFISLIFKSCCHMNSTTFGQWEVQSIANILDKRTPCMYILQVFLCYFIYYYIVCVPTRCMNSGCCISWYQAVWWCITLWRNDVRCCVTLHNVAVNNNVIHCIMWQWIIMCYTILNFMMLHCIWCYTVKCGDSIIT